MAFGWYLFLQLQLGLPQAQQRPMATPQPPHTSVTSHRPSGSPPPQPRACRCPTSAVHELAYTDPLGGQRAVRPQSGPSTASRAPTATQWWSSAVWWWWGWWWTWRRARAALRAVRSARESSYCWEGRTGEERGRARSPKDTHCGAHSISNKICKRGSCSALHDGCLCSSERENPKYRTERLPCTVSRSLAVSGT